MAKVPMQKVVAGLKIYEQQADVVKTISEGVDTHFLTVPNVPKGTYIVSTRVLPNGADPTVSIGTLINANGLAQNRGDNQYIDYTFSNWWQFTYTAVIECPNDTNTIDIGLVSGKNKEYRVRNTKVYTFG